MKITEVRIQALINDDSPLRSVASVTFDDQFVVHNVKVIYAREKYSVAMPSRKMKDGTYRNTAHPINREFREELENAVMPAYRKALEAADNRR